MNHRPLTREEVRRALPVLVVTLSLLAFNAIRALPARAAEPDSMPSPIRLEAVVGSCKQGIAKNGTWWSNDYPTSIDSATGCYQLGASQITGAWRGWDLGWRAGWLDFGAVSANNVFAMRDDEQFNGVMNGAGCDPRTFHRCVGRGVMSQDVKGVMVGALAEHDVGAWTLGLDAGGYAYHSRFKVTIVPHWRSRFRPFSVDWDGLNVTPYLGVTAARGYFFATARTFWTIRASESCGHCTGMTSGAAYQIAAGIQVPLR